MEQGLTSRDWEEAIQVQDACNLSGVVHSFSRVVSKVREQLCIDTGGKYSTDDVNQHPICKMYAEKILHLAGECSMDTFSECQEQAERLKEREVQAVEENV